MTILRNGHRRGVKEGGIDMLVSGELRLSMAPRCWPEVMEGYSCRPVKGLGEVGLV